MSKSANRHAGRKAWINTLLKQGRNDDAAAYAAKNGLSEWLSSLTTISVMISSAQHSPLTAAPSPTLPLPNSLHVEPLTPGGAGVAIPATTGNGDELARKPQNPQCAPVGTTPHSDDNSSSGSTATSASLVAAVAPEAWLDAADMEPEMLEAIRNAPTEDSRCAALTEAGRPAAAPNGSGLGSSGRQDPDLTAGAREENGRKSLPVELNGLPGAEAIRTAYVARVDSASQNEATLESVAEARKQPWPEKDEATAVRECKNPRFMLVALTDGRLVSMWRQGRKWPLRGKVAVRLCQPVGGDPLYEPTT